MNVEERLKEMNIVIPQVTRPLASYVPAIAAGSLVFVSGQLPMSEGSLLYSGKVGVDLSIEEGEEAARQAMINCLAALFGMLGDWEALDRIVKVTGYIQCREDFTQQPRVLNGASNLLEQIFGDKGLHARAAVGVNALPLNAACEVELIAKLK